MAIDVKASTPPVAVPTCPSGASWAVSDSNTPCQLNAVMLNKIATAIRILALFTLATGFMILIAATITARRERASEVRLLRTLGGSTSILRRIIATEAIALGALAAAVGSGVACVGSWALVVFVFKLPFTPPWLDLLGLAAATLGLSAILGGGGGSDLRSEKLAPGLPESS